MYLLPRSYQHFVDIHGNLLVLLELKADSSHSHFENFLKTKIMNKEMQNFQKVCFLPRTSIFTQNASLFQIDF